MKDIMITVKWDWERGESSIHFSGVFETSDWVTQMDCMVDAKRLITDRYDSQLPAPAEPKDDQ